MDFDNYNEDNLKYTKNYVPKASYLDNDVNYLLKIC